MPVGLTPYPMYGLAFSPDGSLLATVGSQVRLWDARTGRQVADLFNVPDGGYQDAVAFSPDGTLLATAGGADIRLWNVATRRPYGAVLSRSIGSGGIGPFSVVFSPHGKLLAADGGPGINLWSVATRAYLGTMTLPETSSLRDFSAVAFSPDGKLLAAAGGPNDPGVQLWNMSDRQPLGAPLATQSNGVDSVAFSPDGKLLAAGGDDGSITLWDVATRQEFGTPLKLHTAAVNGLAFNPAGTLLGSASSDGTARLWATPQTWIQQACQIAGRNLTLAEGSNMWAAATRPTSGTVPSTHRVTAPRERPSRHISAATLTVAPGAGWSIWPTLIIVGGCR